ncbi:hypothetical protein F4780DRAFT_615934 [Xylariomycetidae sp. FL0641]|nr:hypothetical protein F4780DRAFT_615934 [Xylariomycetidae sp. FL0641]
MAGLQVMAGGKAGGREKARQDAVQMQRVVEEDCHKSGKQVPPYTLTELIGKGSFGRVYTAEAHSNHQLVAVKIIDVDESDTQNPKMQDTYSEFLKEINALRLLSESGARNINSVIEALPVGQAMWMVTEYCAGGSVATLMKPTAPGGLLEKWIIPILREVAEAIFWVHRQGIIHRDIKCANVLVTEEGGVQLCDFGVAGMMETKVDKRTTFIGTLHWMAPELFDQNAQYGTEVDIWAFGSMVYEIASGLPPNVRTNVGLPQFGDYLREHLPRLEGDQYSDNLKSLVAFCMEDDPAKRPSIEQIQKHPYIHNTSATYPTSSLANLVKAYKLWEDRGGSRKSLFAGYGAQGPTPADVESTAMAADEWNFSTTLAFDERIHSDPDGRSDVEAVRDVYGTDVEFPASFSGEGTARPKPRGRRRPPPQALAAVKAPLEKVFDPNTISNYEDNSRMYYGRPMMPPPDNPPTSDLPLRDDSLHSTLRESLIDLDASLDGAQLSSFVDMGTIRPGPDSVSGPTGGPVPRNGPRMSMDNNWSFSSAASTHDRAPLSDPADHNNGRNPPDWQWPTVIPPASANPELSHFPINDGRPRLQHHETEPAILPSQGYDQVADPAPDRMSTGSLIDLDMSMPDPGGDMSRPSTSHSDVGSITGSDAGTTGPFELERHTSVYAPLPLTNREPSIYASLPASNREPSLYASMPAGNREPSLYAELPRTNREPSLYADLPATNREPSLYADFPASNREPSLYADLPATNREPSLYADLPATNREPSLYAELPRTNREPSIYADLPANNREPSLYIDIDLPDLPTNREPSIYASLPMTNREPSIYVSADSEYANNVAALSQADTDVASENGSVINGGSGPPSVGEPTSHPHQREQNSMDMAMPMSMGLQLPPVAAPAPHILEARGSNAEVAAEMRRLIGGLSDHLVIIGDQVGAMEPRRGSRASRGEERGD